MIDNKRQTFKEILDLIPQILTASKICLQRENQDNTHDEAHIQENLQRFQTGIELIQGKWSINVVYMIYVLQEPSYNELLKSLPGINSRTLTNRLRLLESRGILQRVVHDTTPLHVTYKVSDFGNGWIYSLIPAILYSTRPELLPKDTESIL
jgi:DNA-binding HxlR family transcriptional regulator